MEITRIGKTNKEYFKNMLPASYNQSQVALGIIEDDTAVGCGIFSLKAGAAELEYIFIEPEYRRKGLAKIFFKDAAETLKENGIFTIIAFIHNDKVLYSYLKSCGFICKPALSEYSFMIWDVVNSKQVKRLFETRNKVNVCPLNKIDKVKKTLLVKYSKNKGADESLFDPEQYDEKLSYAAFVNGEPVCLLLAKQTGKHDVYISFLVSFKKNHKCLLSVIAYFFRAALFSTGKNGKVYFLDGGTRAVPLVDHLLKGKKKTKDCGCGYFAVLDMKGDN